MFFDVRSFRFFIVTCTLPLLLAGCLPAPDLTESGKYECQTSGDCLKGFGCYGNKCVALSELDGITEDVPGKDAADVGAETTSDTREVEVVEGKRNGEVCDDDGECQSANCRETPAGEKQCVTGGAACADGEGGGLAVGKRVCYGGDSFRCTAEDEFEEEDCARSCDPYGEVDKCEQGECVACPTTCLVDEDCVSEAYCNEQDECAADEGIGMGCDRDGMCSSGACRQGPGGISYCVLDGAACADGAGGSLQTGDSICQDTTSLTCTGEDQLTEESCSKDCDYFPDVSSCQAGACEPCATSCTSDGDCDSDGYCDLEAAPKVCVGDEADGEGCDRDGMCVSGNCRKAPDDSFQCAPVGALCADGSGQGLLQDEKVCHEGDSYSCTGENSLTAEDCDKDCGYYPDVDSCSGGACTPCAESCSGNEDCKDPEQVAVCDVTSHTCVAAGGICNIDSDCVPDVCLPAPDGTKRCAPTGSDCSDGQGDGGGLTVGQSVCYQGDAYACQAGGSFTSADCADDCDHYQDVDDCTAGSCVACATSCTAHSDCDLAAHCNDSSQCVADLIIGQACNNDDDRCESGNCRKAPDNSYYCVADGAKCSDGDGGSLTAGEGTCYGGDSWSCQGADSLLQSDCANDCGYYDAVDDCSGGQCAACPTSCSSDNDCDNDAYCEGTCEALKSNGQSCSRDEMCDSDNCRKATNDQYYCTPAGKACSDGAGGGYAQDEVVECQGDAPYVCTAQDTFAIGSCSDCGDYLDAVCSGSSCEACPTSCDSSDDCDVGIGCLTAPDGTQHCANGDCTDNSGQAMTVGETTCHASDQYTCADDDEFGPPRDCLDTTCNEGQTECNCDSTPCDDLTIASSCDGDVCVCGSRSTPCPNNQKCVEGFCECDGEVCAEFLSDRCTTVGGCSCGTLGWACPLPKNMFGYYSLNCRGGSCGCKIVACLVTTLHFGTCPRADRCSDSDDQCKCGFQGPDNHQCPDGECCTNGECIVPGP